MAEFDPTRPLRMAGELFLSGQRGAAVAELTAALHSLRDATLVARAAELFGQMAAHTEALACHRRLVQWLPRHPEVLRGLASAETVAGSLDEAERLLRAALAIDPADADSAYALSQLRRQTPQSNNVLALRARLADRSLDRARRVPLGYALAKELEDLGDHAASFDALHCAADTRRAGLSYDVQTDVDAMARIAAVFDQTRLRRGHTDATDARPMFVTGLPRTGTTLVERILGTVPGVAALGELTEFPMAVTRMTAGTRKAETIERAGTIDAAALGRAYVSALSGYTDAAMTIDKLPSNFLYIGLIHLSLPRARIVHLRRHPMDAAYAIYKTLFRMGYPYSYSLTDLARYYAAYERLMRHWRTALPGRVVEVAYEDIARDPIATTQRLFAALDLPWSADCLEFHRRAAPVATASAAQVRSPVHATSVGAWRRHAEALAPFAQALRHEGIDPRDSDD